MLRQNKEKEFQSFYLATSKKIYNYVLKMTRDEDSTMDVVQQSYLIIFEKFEKINNHQAYLFRIAYSKTMDFFNEKKKINKLVEELYVKESIYNNSEELDYSKRVEEEISHLSFKQKSVILLKVYEKKSYKEIAKIMNISEKAVDTLLVRARKALKIKLADVFNNMEENFG